MGKDICFCMLVVLCLILIEYFSFQMDVDGGKCLASRGICNGSNFRERLMKVLKSPYDQHEYDFYLDEISCRKPLVRHRELRSRVLKAYTLESCGNSYLHIYSGECF